MFSRLTAFMHLSVGLSKVAFVVIGCETIAILVLREKGYLRGCLTF